MTSIPNGFSSHGDDAMNIRSSRFRSYESKMVESVFVSSDHTNHYHGLLSSSHAFSSSFGFNRSHVAYQMRKNIVSTLEMPCMTQVSHNPHLSQISITQTITNRYSTIIPTNDLITVQNEYHRAMNPNFLNSSFYPPNFVERQYSEILNPTPLNVVPPHQTSVYPRHLDMFSFPPKHHHDQHVPHRQAVKKRCRPTGYFQENFEVFNSKEDEEDDGRIHSLPYQKYGPYTCPKCNSVFDTSQKFAAHVSAVHYKNETIDDKFRRYNARNKKRLYKTNQMIHEEAHKIQPEESVEEESGGNHNITSDPEAFQLQMIAKEEPTYDLF